MEHCTNLQETSDYILSFPFLMFIAEDCKVKIKKEHNGEFWEELGGGGKRSVSWLFFGTSDASCTA
jgi:hypothetical protein